MTLEELHLLNESKNKQRRITAKEYRKTIKDKERREARKAAPSEHILQVRCVNWFRQTYPDLIIFAIPNGGYRSKKTAAQMKAEGQLAGIPDLMLAKATARFAGLFIEMKNGSDNTTTDNQRKMIERLKEAGYLCEVVHNEEEFRIAIIDFLSIL